MQTLEPFIRQHLTDFLEQIKFQTDCNTPIDLTRGFRCLVADTIMRYSYDQPFGAIQSPRFTFPMLEALDDFFQNNPYAWYLPTIAVNAIKLLNLLPRSYLRFDPGISAGFSNLDACLARILQLRAEPSSQQTPSVFRTALNPNTDKSQPILTDAALAADALTIFTAGTDTTSHALVTCIYNLLRHPHTLNRLQAELRIAIPHSTSLSTFPLDLTQLETLPYLRAVIKESLRLSYGVPGKLPRMVPPEGAVLANTRLPAGTAVSMACHTYHHNPSFFPNPDEWSPER